MTWRVEWLPPAERALLRISWRDAARVDAAVQRYATSSEGSTYRLSTDDAATIRLRVPPYVVRMSVDRPERVLYVWIVFRLR